MASIKMASITMPEHYVRGKINSKNVNDLMDVVCNANGETDWHKLVGKKLKWPFHTPIEVAKNLTPEVKKPLEGQKGVKREGKGKRKATVFKPHEIIDGGHRVTVWRRLKQKEIEGIIKNIQNPAERFLEQYRTNASHGLRLDKDSRDNAIRTAHEIYKISLSNLAKETGLDRSSIVRIISSKQRTGKPKAKTKGKFAEPTGVADEMSVEAFIDRVQTLHANYQRLHKGIEDFLVANITNSGRSKLGSIVTSLRHMADSFELPLKTKDGKGETKKPDDKPLVGNLPPGTQI